jgi:hypothetical protein
MERNDMTEQNRPETTQKTPKSDSSENKMMIISAVVGVLILIGIMGAGKLFQHPDTPSMDTDMSAQTRGAPNQ